MASNFATGKSGKGKRAILKDSVSCCADEARTTAPRGEYDIEEVAGAGGVCSIGLCSCATHNRFTLSFDAFVQHLNEGRIAYIGG